MDPCNNAIQYNQSKRTNGDYAALNCFDKITIFLGWKVCYRLALSTYSDYISIDVLSAEKLGSTILVISVCWDYRLKLHQIGTAKFDHLNTLYLQYMSISIWHQQLKIDKF